MQGACQCILTEIRQSEQRRKSYAAHAAHQRTFLCVKAVRPYSFVSEQVQSFVFFGIIGFLKNGHIVRTAFVEILVFIGIDGIDLKTDHTEILSRQLTSFTDVFHITLSTALACEYEDLLHTAVSNNPHLFFDLFHGKLHTVNMVIAVKSAVNTVIFTVVGYVQGSKEVHCVTEMLACFNPCPLRHLFKKRLCRRRKERLKVLDGAGFMF